MAKSTTICITGVGNGVLAYRYYWHMCTYTTNQRVGEKKTCFLKGSEREREIGIGAMSNAMNSDASRTNIERGEMEMGEKKFIFS